ncbi:MAG: AMP-binding protein, partial [Pseudomonadota bacterium]
MSLNDFYDSLEDDALTPGEAPLTQSFFSTKTKSGFIPQTIHSMMAQKTSEIEHQPALHEVLADASLGRSWTYSELHADAEKLGRALANRHARGDRIAVFANNLPEWILLELASAYAGTVLVTVNPALLAREVRYVLEQSKASAIYFADFVRGRELGPVVEEATAGLDHITYCIRLADEASMYDGHDRGTLRETKPEDVVQIQYTSGTTGFPKGALLHQMGLIQNGIDSVGRMGANTGDRLPLYMPLFHTAGCAILTLGGLSRGTTLYLMADFDPAVAVNLIATYNLKFMMGVPTMLVAIMDVAEKTGTDVTAIEGVLSGGSMVAP